MDLIQATDVRFAPRWGELWADDPWQPPLYSALSSAYSMEYASASRFVDASCVIADMGRPLAAVSAAVNVLPSGERELSSFGRPILFLEHSQGTRRELDRAFEVLKRHLEAVASGQDVGRILYRQRTPGITRLGLYLLAAGATATPHLTQIIDLTCGYDALHTAVRRSYKSLINWGQNNLALRVLDAETIQWEDVAAFRALHVAPAGRETRSLRTWELQYEMVRSGEGFIVDGHLDGVLVTAALFSYSARCCYYSVAASRRDMFNKPLGHAVIWQAIRWCLDMGLSYFELGEQVFAGTPPREVAEKEMAISAFKRGFGGVTEAWLDIVWQRRHDDKGTSQ